MLITEVTQPQLDLSTIIKGARLGARMLKQLPVQEGLGRTLGTAALAGSLALANPAQAQDVTGLGTKLAYCAGEFAAMTQVLGMFDQGKDNKNFINLYNQLAKKSLDTSQQLIDKQTSYDIAKTRLVDIMNRVKANDATIIGDVADSLQTCAATLEKGQSVNSL
jgi:hypothetical protein